jgi:hypothetical protein
MIAKIQEKKIEAGGGVCPGFITVQYMKNVYNFAHTTEHGCHHVC